ncbi:MAG: rhodanese-related sulfurtransferase [Alphaproteobacteria bacterium]|nr:rhodanese-related sulfurtransferase [Alphaproteobacteria bacterium]
MTQDAQTYPFQVAALYRFVPIADIPALRAQIYAFADENVPSICGTLLLAPEGINGTIAAHPEDMDKMVAFLDETLGVRTADEPACEFKFSHATHQPFNRFKVRPKKELITLRKPEADPHACVGEYVSPEQWNALIDDPDVVLVDTRNDYETKVGTFEGAIDPDIEIFTEFPDWVEKNLDPKKHKKVAMFCTGGIRCEKASSYMLAHGFENVYHLKGGILKYLETIPADQSKWNGDCFVFDQRVAVGHGLQESDWAVCHGCREPLSAEDCERAEFEQGVSCHHCHGDLTSEKLAARRQRQAHYAERYAEEH